MSLITPWILAISISSLPSSFPCIKVSDPTSSTNSTLSFMGPFSSILKSSGLRPTFTFPLNFEIVFNEDWLEKVTILFLQSPFMDVFIPSTPQEAYDHVRYMSELNNPSVMLEHRWLYKTKQKIILKKKKKIKKKK